MSNEVTLEAISQLIDDKLARQKQDIISETSRNTMALMESYFDPKFNLLTEEITDIKEKLIPRSRFDDLEEEVRFLKSLFSQMKGGWTKNQRRSTH